MFTRVVVFISLVFYSTNAQHGHGATSYSTISLGGGHGGGLALQTLHAAPVAVHATPIALQHAAPIALQHIAPLAIQHSAPIAFQHTAPLAIQPAPILAAHGHQQVDYYAHPKYEFKYGVDDAHSGDRKSQHEIRDGDVVQGEYSLQEADGTTRTVKYVADKSGFNAQVIRSGHAAHPAVVAHKPTALIASVPLHQASLSHY